MDSLDANAVRRNCTRFLTHHYPSIPREALAALPELTVRPQPSQTNMFHLFLRGDKAALEQALLEVAAETGVWLFHPLRPCQLPGHWMAEWVVGDASLDIAPDATIELLHTVLRRAASLRVA